MYTCFYMKNRHKYYYYFVFSHVGKKNDFISGSFAVYSCIRESITLMFMSFSKNKFTLL